MVRFKQGQIWVETALYLLIGMGLIAMFLAFATPEIQKQRDKIIFESSLESMINLDNSINDIIRKGAGNQKRIDFFVRQGVLRIDGIDNKISLIIEGSRFEASTSELSPLVKVSGTNLNVRTTPVGETGRYKIEIFREFDDSSFDIQYEGESNGLREFSQAPTPYNIIFTNSGRDNNNNNLIINVKDVS